MKRVVNLGVLFALVMAVSAHAALGDDDFDSDGVRIRFVVEGEGNAVLLIHGFANNLEREYIEPGIFAELVSSGYRVVAFDLRGHGKSEWPLLPEKYGLEMVEDARRLLDHLDIERAHVVGYSLGGAIAAKFGELFPDRVRSLTLGGTEGPFWFPELLSENQAAKILSDWGIEDEMSPKAVVALTVGFPDLLPEESAMRESEIPALIMVGDNDIHKEGAKTLARMIPGAKFRLVPGGHDEASLTSDYLSSLLEFLRDRDVD